MQHGVFSLLPKRERKVNRIFAGSFLDGTPHVREQAHVVFNFSNTCAIESTIYDLLSVIGFDLRLKGTEYVMYALVETLDKDIAPSKIGDLYKLVAEQYNQSYNQVKVYMMRAVRAIKTSTLFSVNKYLGCKIIPNDSEIQAGRFIHGLASRLLMMKRHGKSQSFFQ